MKKILKLLVAVCLVSAMLFSLTGCDYIDELRASQGFWQEDGSILLRGELYFKLPESKLLAPKWGDTIYITEPDVPVLLSADYGDWADASVDGIFIYNYDGSEKAIYCRQDKYEQVKKQIENGVDFNTYCYDYYFYNEDTWEYEDKVYILTEKQKQAVDKVMAEVEPEENIGSIYWNAEMHVQIETRSADLIFSGDPFDIVVYENDRYYVVTGGDELDFVYTVPNDLVPIFKDICAEYKEANYY